MLDTIFHNEDLQHNGFIHFTADLAQLYGTLPLPPQINVRGELAAFVNHGRWLVQCPTCRSAAWGSRETPLFFCVECGNPDNRDHWYKVVYPAVKETIEALLLLRPAAIPRNAENRNWQPGETVEDLRRENVAHGLGG